MVSRVIIWREHNLVGTVGSPMSWVQIQLIVLIVKFHTYYPIEDYWKKNMEQKYWVLILIEGSILCVILCEVAVRWTVYQVKYTGRTTAHTLLPQIMKLLI